MIFIDTGYLVAQVRPRDSLYARAKAWSAVVNEPLLVSEYVLWETVNALSAPLDRPKAHAILEQLDAASDCEIVPASPRLWHEGIELHKQRADKEWSLTDCISFYLMNERGITRVLAYDHDFEQAGFEALLCRDPD